MASPGPRSALAKAVTESVGTDVLRLENLESCPRRREDLDGSTVRYTWTRRPFGEEEAPLGQAECMILGESYVVRPWPPRSRDEAGRLHADLLELKDRLPGLDMILDLVRFPEIPVTLVSFIFAVGEDLRAQGGQLVLMGLTPGMLPTVVLQRIYAEFEVI